MKFNHAAMWYCLSAIKFIDKLPKSEIRKIGFEIGLKGRSGFDMDDPNKKYHIESLNKDLSGLQAVSWMFVTWKKIDASKSVGIDFQEEYLLAKRLFEIEMSKKAKNSDEPTEKTYVYNFDEVDVNSDMSDLEILMKVVKKFGFNNPKAITADIKRIQELILIDTLEYPQDMSLMDEDQFQQAISNASSGNVDYALQVFLALSNKYPNRAIILENIARCYLEIQKCEKAINYYEKSLRFDRSVNAFIGLGNAYQRNKNLNKAIQNFEDAISVAPSYFLSYNNLGAALAEAGRLDDAEKYLKKALRLEPSYPQTLYGLGLVKQYKKEYEKSKYYFQEALKLSADNYFLREQINNRLREITKETNVDIIKSSSISIQGDLPVLLDDVRTIILSVEELTGKSVKFVKLEDIVHYAGIKIARSDDNYHQMYYKDEHNDILQHLIAHECCHVLRIFQADPSERVVPATDKSTQMIAYKEMQSEISGLSKSIPENLLGEQLNLWYHGIVRQLTNFPADYMIECYLYDNYPSLRAVQLKSLQKQLIDSKSGLLNAIRRNTPSLIYSSSNIMNYTFFRLIGLHIKFNLTKPYSSSEFLTSGKQLASYTSKNYNNSFSGDVSMTNYWAKYFKLYKWFRWVDFEKNK